MKRIFFYIFAAVLLCSSSLVEAKPKFEYAHQPYAGLDFEWKCIKLTCQGINSIYRTQVKFPQTNVYVGMRFNEYYALEIGTGFSPQKGSRPSYSTSNFHTSVIGFIPLDDRFEVLGGVGLTHLKHVSKTNTTTDTLVKHVPRVLLGAQLWACDNVGIRANAIMNPAKPHEIDARTFKTRFHYGVGLQYLF